MRRRTICWTMFPGPIFRCRVNRRRTIAAWMTRSLSSPPLRAEDWERILTSVEQEEDIEEAIEAMDAPAPAPAPAALGLGWLFSGSNDIAAFTWRSFCGWPVGVVQDTDDTLHILLCVREQLGLPPLDSMRLLTAPLHEPPAVRPSWDRYAQENLFCLS